MMYGPAIPAKEFAEKINSGDFKQSAHLFGKVKKSENKDEVLFAFKAPKLHWMPLPLSMIDHVHVIKSFKIEDEDVSLVKIKLNPPSGSKESAALYELLTVLSEKMMCFMKMKKKWMMGGDMGDMDSKRSCSHKCSHHHGD